VGKWLRKLFHESVDNASKFILSTKMWGNRQATVQLKCGQYIKFIPTGVMRDDKYVETVSISEFV
jgi:hypothetical protein